MKKWLIVFMALCCLLMWGCNKAEQPEQTENQAQTSTENKNPTESQTPTEGQAPTENQTPIESQAPTEGQGPTEGQTPTEATKPAETTPTTPTQPGHEHSFGAWTTATRATCQKEGSERRTCSTCKAEETRTVGKIDHKFSATTLACTVCRYVDTTSTAAVVELGNIANYEAGNAANYVWDVKVWNGKIYRGAGDYDKNSGNTDFMVFNIAESKWELAGTATDEALHRFVEIGGKLYAPGIDSRDSGGWDYGNYYVLENGKWVKTRNVPNGVHCFDMIGFGGKMYIGVGTETVEDTVAVSSDNGASWTYLPLYKDNAPFDTSTYEWSRTYAFAEYNNTFYALLQFKLKGKTQYDMLVFRYDNGKMVYEGVSKMNNRIGRNYWQAAFEWKGQCYIAAKGLYTVGDFADVSTMSGVRLPGREIVSDAILYKDVMYVLSYTPNSDGSYKTAIYKNTTGASDGYVLVASFDYAGIPYSFDYDGSHFYVGIGQASTNSPEKAGMLLRVKP